jgi:hypothetical protein
MMQKNNIDRYPSWEAVRSSVRIIEALGGRVKLPPNLVVCWNTAFPSLGEVAKDPRCEVKYSTLISKVAECDTLEEATRLSSGSNMTETVCWGQVFRSIADVAADPRCQVSYTALRKKLSQGIPCDEAVQIGNRKRPIITIDEMLAKAKRQRRRPNAET